jgi:hypothetical protein
MVSIVAQVADGLTLARASLPGRRSGEPGGCGSRPLADRRDPTQEPLNTPLTSRPG